MAVLLHELIADAAERGPESEALGHGRGVQTYEDLWRAVERTGRGLIDIGLVRGARVAVWSGKRPDSVAAIFGASYAGGAFIPVNPVLKARQVEHILTDSGATVLFADAGRLEILKDFIGRTPNLKTVVLDPDAQDDGGDELNLGALMARGDGCRKGPIHRTENELAAILYTSGSTGRPKGVMLSHRNIISGAQSVSRYLSNRPDDRLLAVLPLSFDYGFSQLTTAFHVGAFVQLLDYLLPRDVIRQAEKQAITGLAAVPPLWTQLAKLDWPESVAETLRYITNTGGKMPVTVTRSLQSKLPKTKIFLMYGLTEAFRSTYLPPDQVSSRPESIGKGVPNAEVVVLRPDGTYAAAGEPGELVHRGPFVAMGYWNNPEASAERFRPVPPALAPGMPGERVVWSGDQVMWDADGYIYFIGREDEMIKTSGYRVSPSEIEELAYSSGLVDEAAALGVPHEELGEQIVLIVTLGGDQKAVDSDAIGEWFRREAPGYMVPAVIEPWSELPRSPNGKIDRVSIKQKILEGQARDGQTHKVG